MLDAQRQIPVVVGSRSPRRLELLRTIVAPERLVALPPQNAEEPGFEDIATLADFEVRILEIVEVKQQDVVSQIQRGAESAAVASGCIVICADTTVVVQDADGRPLALGQPPDGDRWPETVRRWFHAYLAGKTHTVMSGVSATLLDAAGQVQQTAAARLVHRNRRAHWQGRRVRHPGSGQRLHHKVRRQLQQRCRTSTGRNDGPAERTQTRSLRK
jgi:predicted house-cleaning NTP pyrophosphatase (Maf/HAM1 superfamily)